MSALSSTWVDARSAAIFLKPCTPRHVTEELGPLLKRKPLTRPGASTARGAGYAYHRHDLERVRAIMDALGVSALRAAQLFHALKVLTARELVPWLLEELVDELEQRQQHKRRRFQ